MIGRRQFLFRSSMLIAGVLLFFFTFRNINIATTLTLISDVGYLCIVIFSFYFVGCIFDSLAWQQLLPTSQSISFIRIVLIHIAGESFYRFLPAGVVVGESVKVMLMAKHTSVPTPHIVSSLLMRKVFLGLAQALYIGVVVLAGITIGSSRSDSILTQTGLTVSFLLLIVFLTIGYFLAKGNLGSVSYRLLMRLPFRAVQTMLYRTKKTFFETDIVVKNAIVRNSTTNIAAILFFFCGWLTELAETYCILFLLGAKVSFQDVMIFEPVVSFLRSVVFFIPAGLGVMDIGYSASLQSAVPGMTMTIAAAFIIIKRAKELFWIIIGVSVATVLGRIQFTNKRFHSHPQNLTDIAPAQTQP
ncbi:MAG: lysylphosphatidylglycerol synthase transmembrane domain-containing protein [Bacteroidota bacterium]